MSVGIILKDWYTVLHGNFQKPFPSRGRECVPRRVLEVDYRINEFDPVSSLPGLLEYLRDQLYLHSFTVAGNSYETGLSVFQRVGRSRIGWLLNDHGISRIQHNCGEKIHDLLRPCCDAHFVEICYPSHSRSHPSGDEFLQRFITSRCPILEDLLPSLGNDRGGFLKFLHREYFGIRVSPRKGYHSRFLHVFDKFPYGGRSQFIANLRIQFIPHLPAQVRPLSLVW